MHYFVIFTRTRERDGCFALIIFLMSCYCKCYVALSHGATDCLKFVIVVFSDHTHLLFYIHSE